MPPEVEAAIRSRLLDDVPGYTRLPPPRLPGAENCHGGDEQELADAMLVAWKGVHRRKTGKDYQGRVSKKRLESIAEGARILRAEGVSPWVYFDHVWTAEVERSRKPPQFFSAAGPTMVGRYVQRVVKSAPRLDQIAVNGEARAQLLDLRAAALQRLRRERPMDAAAAVEIVDQIIPEERYNDLLARVRQECVAAKRRDIASLDRGVWIWG